METFCLKAIEDIGVKLHFASKENKEQVIVDMKLYFDPDCIKEGMSEVLRYFEGEELWTAFEIAHYNIDFRNQKYVSSNETYLPPPNKWGFFVSHSSSKINDKALLNFYDNVLGPYHEKLVERIEEKLKKKNSKGGLNNGQEDI